MDSVKVEKKIMASKNIKSRKDIQQNIKQEIIKMSKNIAKIESKKTKFKNWMKAKNDDRITK